MPTDQPTDAGKTDHADLVARLTDLSTMLCALGYPKMADTARAAADALEAEARVEALKGLYYELLYSVGNKYPGETRHQTALRYIRNAERPNMETQGQASAYADQCAETKKARERLAALQREPGGPA